MKAQFFPLKKTGQEKDGKEKGFYFPFPPLPHLTPLRNGDVNVEELDS